MSLEERCGISARCKFHKYKERRHAKNKMVSIEGCGKSSRNQCPHPYNKDWCRQGEKPGHEEEDMNKSDGPLDGMKDVQKELEHLSQPVASSLQNLGNLRLVNQEWNGVCSPFIFRVCSSTFSVSRRRTHRFDPFDRRLILSNARPNPSSTFTATSSLVTQKLSSHCSSCRLSSE